MSKFVQENGIPGCPEATLRAVSALSVHPVPNGYCKARSPPLTLSSRFTAVEHASSMKGMAFPLQYATLRCRDSLQQSIYEFKKKGTDMKCVQSFSILIWANRAKADQSGLLPIYARVTVMGKRAEISLKKKVKPEKWDAATGCMKGTGEEVRLVNKYINDVRNQSIRINAVLMNTSRLRK